MKKKATQAMNSPINPRLQFHMDVHLVSMFQFEDWTFIGLDEKAAKPYKTIANEIEQIVQAEFGEHERLAMENRSGDHFAHAIHGQGELKPAVPVVFEKEALLYVRAKAFALENGFENPKHLKP